MTTQEPAATEVLLALWRARGTVSIGALERQTAAPIPRVLAAIEALRRRGCLIEQSPLGIELISVGLACWRELLETHLAQANTRIGRRTHVLPQTVSTNDIAWQAPTDQTSDGLVILADEQNSGRGRRGHSWHAKPGQSVLMSVLLLGMGPDSLDRLTLLAGLAAAEGIERAAVESGRGGPGVHVGIRWPNDLQIGARKLGGILVEGRNLGNTPAAVVGIGINVAQGPDDFPPELAGRAVSLFQVAGTLVDRVRVAVRVLEALDRRIYQTHGNAWMDEWKSRCGLLGQRVTAHDRERAVTGMVIDIDPLQGLVLRDEAGGTQFLSARTSSLSAP